jgi:hypothetical protein
VGRHHDPWGTSSTGDRTHDSKQDELGRCAAQGDIAWTYAAAISPRAGVYPRWIARGRMIRMIQSPGRGHSGGSGGYPPCQAIGLASAPAYVNAAERRADTEMRDAGETRSVMGAGPEASARAIGGNTSGGGTDHRRRDGTPGAGPLGSV